jgi:hypothetical protein
MRGTFAPCFIFLVCVLATACTKPIPRAKVAGKVTIGGKAATAGEVKFHAGDGALVTAFIQGDGSYTAIDVPAGEVKISIHPPPNLIMKGSAPKGTTTIGPPEDGAAPTSTLKGPGIPIKYTNVESSGLATTLIEGDNQYEIKLAPGPAAAMTTGTSAIAGPPTIPGAGSGSPAMPK